jgi:hypothetical protein
MAKTTVIYRDKDSGDLTKREVAGPITALQTLEKLREEGHDPIGHRESR